MSNNYRELTGREKQRIKKLITSLCANYDKEYGCLPLDCDCPMLGICSSNAGDRGSIPGQGTKILNAVWCGQKNNRTTIEKKK